MIGGGDVDRDVDICSVTDNKIAMCLVTNDKISTYSTYIPRSN